MTGLTPKWCPGRLREGEVPSERWHVPLPPPLGVPRVPEGDPTPTLPWAPHTSHCACASPPRPTEPTGHSAQAPRRRRGGGKGGKTPAALPRLPAGWPRMRSAWPRAKPRPRPVTSNNRRRRRPRRPPGAPPPPEPAAALPRAGMRPEPGRPSWREAVRVAARVPAPCVPVPLSFPRAPPPLSPTAALAVPRGQFPAVRPLPALLSVSGGGPGPRGEPRGAGGAPRLLVGGG